MDTQQADQTTFWRVPEYDDMEFLHAQFFIHQFPLHFHEEYVVGVVERGVHEFLYRGNRQLMQANDIVVLNPGEIHGCYGMDEKGWQYRCFYPNITMMKKLAEEITGRDWEIPTFNEPVFNDATLAQQILVLHRAMEYSKTRLARDTVLREAMGLLIRKHASDMPSNTNTLADNRAVALAQDYLQAHYAEDVSLDDLAHEVGLSPYHLSRIFKAQVGLPPHKYLVQIRLQRAKDLLNTEMSIAAVAQEVGFSDQSHLSKWFRRVVGVSPGQFAGE